MDFYDEDAFGDTRGYFFYSLTEPFAKYVASRRETVLLLAGQYIPPPMREPKPGSTSPRGDLQVIAAYGRWLRTTTARSGDCYDWAQACKRGSRVSGGE